ncbi:hypothetical protein [Mesorhizobium sp. M0060]|uniref:hypothetical protein n=1 Tax=Mesorhizobium sp. M0060 TaxID=2956866 RepID=UPI00333C177F
MRSKRRDARYCSNACRQRAARAREQFPDLGELDKAIEAARLDYWALIAMKARATGRHEGEVLTDEAVYVDGGGNVFRCGRNMGPNGRWAGKVKPSRPGWDAWGVEAAGPPHNPPPPGSDVTKRKRRTEKRLRRVSRRADDQ